MSTFEWCPYGKRGNKEFNNLFLYLARKTCRKLFSLPDTRIEQNIKGWIYTSKADNFIFVDYVNEQAVLVERQEALKVYNKIKENYELKEQHTERGGQTWTSTHRWIPISNFCHLHLKYYITNKWIEL